MKTHSQKLVGSSWLLVKKSEEFNINSSVWGGVGEHIFLGPFTFCPPLLYHEIMLMMGGGFVVTNKDILAWGRLFPKAKHFRAA